MRPTAVDVLAVKRSVEHHHVIGDKTHRYAGPQKLALLQIFNYVVSPTRSYAAFLSFLCGCDNSSPCRLLLHLHVILSPCDHKVAVGY